MGNILQKMPLILDRNSTPRTLTTKKDSYHFGTKLGDGTTATVYSARATSDDTEWAIKEISKHSKFCRSPTSRKAVMDEVLTLRSLSHENILRIQDFAEDKHNLYIITELCEKGDLLSSIRKNDNFHSERKGILVMQQVFSALSYMHALGISHGDIKPDNLLLDQNNSIRLADLGLAIRHSPGREKHSIIPVGTPAYTPPEVRRGMQYSPVAVDMWACGVTLFELVRGDLPFTDSEGRSIRVRTQHDVTKVIDSTVTALILSPGVRKLLRDLLQVDPDARIGPEAAAVQCLEILGN